MEIPDPTPVILAEPKGMQKTHLPPLVAKTLPPNFLPFHFDVCCRLQAKVARVVGEPQAAALLHPAWPVCSNCYTYVGAQDAEHSWREVGSGGWTPSARGFPGVREQKRERKDVGLITHSPLPSTVCCLDSSQTIAAA